jgi:hypothetical protein
MMSATANGLTRSVGVVALVVGALQFFLGLHALTTGIGLAFGPAGLTPWGWLGGIAIPAVLLACICVALGAAWSLFRTVRWKQAALVVAACSLLAWFLYGSLDLLYDSHKGTYRYGPAEWFVKDYTALRPNEILGRSAPVRGIYGRVYLSSLIGTLPLVMVVILLVLRGSRAARSRLTNHGKPTGPV